MNNGEKLLIMRNVRRLISSKIPQIENWELYSMVFSCGSVRANAICVSLGLDPTSTKTGNDNA